MRLGRLTLGILLVFGAAAAVNAADTAAEMTGPTSLLEMAGIRARAGEGTAESFTGVATPQEMNTLGILPDQIPPGGLMIGPDGESHNQPLQRCKVYTDRASFDADHGVAFAKPCAGTQCFENFDLTSAGQGALLACTTGAFVDCQANACAVAGAINNGLALRETLLFRDGNAPVAQIGTLNAGPAWFGNNKVMPDGRYITDNFFNDSMGMWFTGSANVVAACVGATVAPTVVGWDQINMQNMAHGENFVTVTLASGAQFVYKNVGTNSGIFNGVCCAEPIRSIFVRNVGNYGEGIDNVRYGVAGTCTPAKDQITNNGLSDQVEAVLDALAAAEAKLDQLLAGGGGTSAR